MLLEVKEHGRLLIFGQCAVPAVFHHADDFSALAAPVFEVAAEGIPDGTEDFDGELAIHEGDGRRFLVVAEGEIPAGDQPRAGGLDVTGRNVVIHGIGDHVGGAEVGGGVGEDEGVAAAEAEGNVVNGADGSDTGDGGDGVNHAALYLGRIVVGVAGHVQVGADQHHVLRIEAEVRVQGSDQAAHGDQR